MIPIGIDVGASDVKAVWGAGRTSVSFPSAVYPYSGMVSLMDTRGQERIKIVSGRKSQEFYYGRLGLIHGVGVPTIQGAYRLEGIETLALYLAAAMEAVPDGVSPSDVAAVVGVPASLANDTESKEKLRRTLTGLHHIETPERSLDINFSVLQVMSQPNGTAFHFLTDWNGAQDTTVSATGQIAVLDIGGETTDVTRMTNVVVDRSDSLRLGMRDVENAVAVSVRKQYGIELDWLGRRDAVVERVVYVNGEKRDIKALVADAVSVSADQIIRFFLATLKTNGEELRYVMLTGGGARAFNQVIERRFQQTRMMVLPELANASGFYKKAVRLLK